MVELEVVEVAVLILEVLSREELELAIISQIDVLDVLRGPEFSESQSINRTSQHQCSKIIGPS